MCLYIFSVYKFSCMSCVPCVSCVRVYVCACMCVRVQECGTNKIQLVAAGAARPPETAGDRLFPKFKTVKFRRYPVSFDTIEGGFARGYNQSNLELRRNPVNFGAIEGGFARGCF